MTGDHLTLLTVHAHPDDESSKGAPTVARYHADGVRTVLVCCTGGEEGDILNSAMDREDVRADLPAVRRRELEAAAAIIGYDAVELLGYRDSGMPGSEANERPDCFARADATEAVGRVVALLRRHRPHVVVTYGDDQELYPHPDHLRVHDVTIAAVDAAADPQAYPASGEPWEVPKLYYSSLPLRKMRMLHERLVAAGHESPFPDDWSGFVDNEHAITTRVHVENWLEIGLDALRAHATQIDPASPMWFGVLPEIERELGGTDDYVLARSTVASDESTGDLFSGLRGGE